MENRECLRVVWAVVPAYQEGAVIGETIRSLRPFVSQIVVVDDGSKDETSAFARAAGAIVVRHAVNLGQGAALQTGITFSLESGADFICTFDADGQHDPATIPAMVSLADATHADVILGSRFLGVASEIGTLKQIVLTLAVKLTRIQTGLRLTDTHNGLRLFSRTAAQHISITQAGMAHASELLEQFAAAHLKILEIPTVVHYTEYSRRKGQRLSNSVKILFDLCYAALSK